MAGRIVGQQWAAVSIMIELVVHIKATHSPLQCMHAILPLFLVSILGLLVLKLVWILVLVLLVLLLGLVTVFSEII